MLLLRVHCKSAQSRSINKILKWMWCNKTECICSNYPEGIRYTSVSLSVCICFPSNMIINDIDRGAEHQGRRTSTVLGSSRAELKGLQGVTAFMRQTFNLTLKMMAHWSIRRSPPTPHSHQARINIDAAIETGQNYSVSALKKYPHVCLSH